MLLPGFRHIDVAVSVGDGGEEDACAAIGGWDGGVQPPDEDPENETGGQERGPDGQHEVRGWFLYLLSPGRLPTSMAT